MPLAGVAKRVEQLLCDPKRCELIVVALPEELPINETIELVKRSEAIGVACRVVVVNQVPRLSMLPEDRSLLDLLTEQNEGSIERFASSASGRVRRRGRRSPTDREAEARDSGGCRGAFPGPLRQSPGAAWRARRRN